jgi:DNA-binding XRE family transcriptional regulator
MSDIKIGNNLKNFILQRKKYIEEVTKKRVNIGDIKRHLAKYCGVSYNNIEMIYKQYSAPSLYVALKIANYFNVSVEDIFYINE